MIRGAAPRQMNISLYEMRPNQEHNAVMTLRPRSHLPLPFLCGYEVETKMCWGGGGSGIYCGIRPESFPGNEHAPRCDVWDPLSHVMAI